MSRLGKIAAGALAIAAVAVYLLTSFVLWDFNPSNWGGDARLAAVIAFAMFSFAGAGAAA